MVMLFCVKSAPLLFKRAINLMLGDLVDICLVVYLDNILIYLAIDRDYTKYITAVFERLAKSKFYLKHKKY